MVCFIYCTVCIMIVFHPEHNCNYLIRMLLIIWVCIGRVSSAVTILVYSCEWFLCSLFSAEMLSAPQAWSSNAELKSTCHSRFAQRCFELKLCAEKCLEVPGLRKALWRFHSPSLYIRQRSEMLIPVIHSLDPPGIHYDRGLAWAILNLAAFDVCKGLFSFFLFFLF